jgi:hypothetical protein
LDRWEENSRIYVGWKVAENSRVGQMAGKQANYALGTGEQPKKNRRRENSRILDR